MIRKAEERDILQLTDIYNEAILHTVATFDTEVKSIENRSEWLKEHVDKYVVFVWEENDIVMGYASLSRYRDRKAFDQTVEISVYIAPNYRNRGIGKALMKEALQFAKEHQEIKQIVSLITGENKVSIALHEKMGFQYCGQFKHVGNKFGRWLDLNFYQYVDKG